MKRFLSIFLSLALILCLFSPVSVYAIGEGNVVGQDFGDTGGFGVFSLNGAYKLSKNFKVSTGIDNLFDKAYAEHLNLAGDAGFGFPGDKAINEPGRTYWTKVDFSF